MTSDQQHNSAQPESEGMYSEGFSTLPNRTEVFGNIRNDSESFRSIPQSAEPFGITRNVSERTQYHTVTVRGAARLFEEAGVARTERSIINWCQPNRHGVARLDAFFDTNEHRYYITGDSITRAIEEERSRKSAGVDHSVPVAEAQTTDAPIPERTEKTHEEVALDARLRDLEITNRVKDQAIKMYEDERKRLMDERENYVRELVAQSRQIGALESRLQQIEAPSKQTQ